MQSYAIYGAAGDEAKPSPKSLSGLCRVAVTGLLSLGGMMPSPSLLPIGAKPTNSTSQFKLWADDFESLKGDEHKLRVSLYIQNSAFNAALLEAIRNKDFSKFKELMEAHFSAPSRAAFFGGDSDFAFSVGSKTFTWTQLNSLAPQDQFAIALDFLSIRIRMEESYLKEIGNDENSGVEADQLLQWEQTNRQATTQLYQLRLIKLASHRSPQEIIDALIADPSNEQNAIDTKAKLGRILELISKDFESENPKKIGRAFKALFHIETFNPGVGMRYIYDFIHAIPFLKGGDRLIALKTLNLTIIRSMPRDSSDEKLKNEKWKEFRHHFPSKDELGAMVMGMHREEPGDEEFNQLLLFVFLAGGPRTAEEFLSRAGRFDILLESETLAWNDDSEFRRLVNRISDYLKPSYEAFQDPIQKGFELRQRVEGRVNQQSPFTMPTDPFARGF